MAAMNTKLDCIKFLVDTLKIDPDLSNDTGWSPLQLACRGKPESAALDCVNYLIYSGANVNRVNDMGISAVHQAVSANNLQCLATLVKHGAHVTCTDKRGLQPLDVAKVWGHSECSKYLQNVMWHERKREEDVKRRIWLAEHHKLLEEEISKYSEQRGADRVHQAYRCWVNKKGSISPKLPSHCAARARPLSCYRSRQPKIPELHRRQIKERVQEKILPLVQYSPRQHLERVKKIQSLRRSISPQQESLPLRVITPETRPMTSDVRIELTNEDFTRPNSCNSTGQQSKVRRQKKLKNMADPNPHLKVEKIGIEPKKAPKKARSKRNKIKVPEDPDLPNTFTIQVDNYFKGSPLISPDSGCYVEEQPGEDSTAHPATDIELNSVNSTVSMDKLIELLGEELEKTDVSAAKTVRFNEDIHYDSEHHSVSFGNSLEQLRSCIKVKSTSPNL